MAGPEEYGGSQTLSYRASRLEQDLRDLRKDMKDHDTWADAQHAAIWKRLDADRSTLVANRTALIIVLVVAFLDIAVNWLPRLAGALAK